MLQTKKSFTLTELLVVVSIIGLLSSVVLASLNNARAKARDTTRISDLKQLQLALALYYDKNGSYPGAQNTVYTSAQASWITTDPLTTLVTQGFISKLPVDPKNTPANNFNYTGSTNYSYYYSIGQLAAPAADYELTTRLEGSGNGSSCQVRGNAYCGSKIWSGWNWLTFPPDGGKIVLIRP